jgi:hypothetical protein
MKTALKATMFLSIFGALALAADMSAPVVANVPFEFTVGNTVLPAGEYQITSGIAQGLIRVASLDRKHTTHVNVIPKKNVTGADASLVFNKYGDRYFLAKVWATPVTVGNEIYKSRMERELMARATAKEEVVVAAVR